MTRRGARADFLATPARRRLLFGALYLSEGAPIGYIWWHLPAKLRLEGVPLDRITALTAMLVLPWMLKFLWAPLVDRLRTRRGTLQAWIAGSQSLMILALVPLLGVDFASHLPLVGALLLVHAAAAATQDVAIDALAIASSGPRERGSINAWMQVGMILGRSLFGGVALLADVRFGSRVVLVALMVAIGASMALLLPSREPEAAARPEGSPGIGRLILAAARDRRTWLGLAFALLGGAAFEAAGAVAGPYLVDRGLAQAAVGWFLAVPVVAAMLLGSFGGWISDRIGRIRAVSLFLGWIALCATLLALAGDAPVAAAETIYVALYLGIGLFTASSYALFMDLSRPELGATQFSTYMAATNGCESWSTFAVGRLAAAWGYAPAFLVMAGVSLVTLPVLRALRRSESSPDPSDGSGDGRIADRAPSSPAASPPSG